MKNISINVDVKNKKKRNYACTVNPLINNAHKTVLPTLKNTSNKSCRFISVCKNTFKGSLLTKVKLKFLIQVSEYWYSLKEWNYVF